MTKIRAEIDVIDSNYCENGDTTCPMCLVGDWGQCYCALFDNVLEIDEENHRYCKRCEKCKQAEVERMNKEQVKKALDCCTSRENKCSKCPYQRPFGCMKMGMIQDALRLINEQEADIKRLETFNDKLSQGIYYGNGEHLCNRLNQAKKQAVKEFAEKLKSQMRDKEYMGVHYKQRLFSDNDIDDLLAEYENEH